MFFFHFTPRPAQAPAGRITDRNDDHAPFLAIVDRYAGRGSSFPEAMVRRENLRRAVRGVPHETPAGTHFHHQPLTK